MINVDDCNFREPMDCNIPKDPSRVVPLTVATDTDQNEPTSISASLIRYKLTLLIHEIRALKADKPHPKDYSIVQRLHEQVTSVMDKIPPVLRHQNPDMSWDSTHPYLPQQRESLLTLANMVIMALHRPHIFAHAESRRAALQAAISTLESQQRSFNQTPKYHYKLFLSFYTIDAAILFCMIIGMDLPHREDVKQQIEHVLLQSINMLALMEDVNPMAKAGLKILQKCHQELKRSFEATTIATRPIADTTSAHQPAGDELTDYLNGQFSNFQQGSQSLASIPVNSDSLPAGSTEGTLPGSDTFDTSFWLDQIGEIPFSASNPLDRDLVWDSLTYEREQLLGNIG